MTDYYLIRILDDLEPQLSASYISFKAVLMLARELRKEDPLGRHGLFWLTVRGECKPEIGAFSNAELEQKT